MEFLYNNYSWLYYKLHYIRVLWFTLIGDNDKYLELLREDIIFKENHDKK